MVEERLADVYDSKSRFEDYCDLDSFIEANITFYRRVMTEKMEEEPDFREVRVPKVGGISREDDCH